MTTRLQDIPLAEIHSVVHLPSELMPFDPVSFHLCDCVVHDCAETTSVFQVVVVVVVVIVVIVVVVVVVVIVVVVVVIVVVVVCVCVCVCVCV